MPVTNNFSSTMQKLAAQILLQRPEGMLEYSLNQLKEILQESRRAAFGQTNLEWRRSVAGGQGEVSCSLYIADNIPNYTLVDDEEGNGYRRSQLSIEVNFPCYGARSPEFIREHLKLMSDICDLAEVLKSTFDFPLYDLIRTKAQREEDARKAEGMKNQSLVKKLISEAAEKLKGMWMNNQKIVHDSRFEQLPSGTYTVEIKKKGSKSKTYTVIPGDGGFPSAASVTRIA